jgi:large conductance mechanosensitive channel
MGLLKEFKEFASKGNVIDLAVGIIIGAEFGKIVSSFVNDVLMPPIGVLVGGINFTDIKIVLKSIPLGDDGLMTPAVTINIGNFIQAVINFIIIAFAVFMVVKAANAMKKKQAEVPAAPPAPPAPSAEEKLLTEIRDLLKKQ